MEKIDDYLNQIGKYNCFISGEELQVDGVLRQEKKNIVFQTQIEQKDYRRLDKLYDELQFCGAINGTPITLMSVHFRRSSSSFGADSVSVEFEPYEIIIGRCYKDEPKVVCMTASITALNYMFSSRPLDLIHSFTKEKPYVLKYTLPNKMEVDDRYGHLAIFQTFSQEWTWDEIRHSFKPIIEYQFNNPIGIMDALGRIAAVRNLLSFFANGYLPLENIDFADEQSKKMDTLPLCDVALYLNHPGDIAVRDEPFLIMTSAFEDNFEQIWQNWMDMYEGTIPIPTLFYEIICNRSTRINCFLNLAQAIEVYSDQYRKADAEEIAKKYENPQPGEKLYVRLKHKIEDVLLFLNDCLEVPDSNIPSIAQGTAKMRNYYTHYNTGRYVEPTYQEMFSATHVLRFVLLAIVYKTLGLCTEAIIYARKHVEFQLFYEDIENILNYASKEPKRDKS